MNEGLEGPCSQLQDKRKQLQNVSGKPQGQFDSQTFVDDPMVSLLPHATCLV